MTEEKDTHHKKEKEGGSGEGLQKLTRERDEYLAGWQRAKADLINFKRETRESLGKFNDLAELGFVRKLLPVLDALEEGKKSGNKEAERILKLFWDILHHDGIEEIVPEENANFDPEFHEALEGEGTTITDVLQKGYKYREYVIRPAKVKVKE